MAFIYPALQKWFSEFFRKNLSSDWGRRTPGIHNSGLSKFKNVYVSTGKLVQDFIVRRSAEGIPVVVTLLKSPWDVPPPFNRAALHLVENSLGEIDGDFLINTNKTITRELTSKDTIYYGDNHPNATVHAVIAAAINQDLWPLLKRWFDLDYAG